MTTENNEKTCEQCGQDVDDSELIVDEETGMLLCPTCAREQDSCGCSDEVE